MDRLRTMLLPLLAAALVLAAVAACGGSDRPTKKESRPRPDASAAKRAAAARASAAEDEARDDAEDEPASPEAQVAQQIQTLETGRVSAKKAALVKLTALGDRELAATAVPAIRECLNDDNADVRGLAGIAILKIKGTEGAHMVRPLLRDSKLEVRASVYNELGKLGKDYDDELMNGLDDDSPEIQEIALDFLSRQKNKRAAQHAIALYQRTESESLRAQILTYLLRIESDKGVSTVLLTLDDLEGPSALTLAVRYLGKYGDNVQALKLVRFLDDLEVPVRIEATRVVEARKIRTLDSIAALVHLLGDNSGQVRAAAHQTLKKLTNQDFGFDPTEFDAEKVKPAIQKWEKWLEKNGEKFPKD